jgi:toxin ParE1/3/4
VRIEWTEIAEADALAIADYISIDDPHAALAVHEEIHRQVGLLGDYPNTGRQGRCAGTRELVITRTPYIVAYRVERLAVVILRVLHAAQRWPAGL